MREQISSGGAGPSDRWSASGKAIPPKLYRIGDLVDFAGVSRQTIHNYTTMGLLTATRWTRGGHRLYDESVFGRLEKILQMRRQRVPMRKIREFFSRQDRR